MSRERFESRRSQYADAVLRVQEAVEDYQSRDRLTAAGFDALRAERLTRDSLIQRFELVYELGWKTLKDWLQDQGVQAVTPKQVLGAAFESRLIDDLAGWSVVQEMRNLSSHVYDEEKARAVADFMLSEGLTLFQALAAQLEKA